jgi:DNA-binding MarR family transcriptional regulator
MAFTLETFLPYRLVRLAEAVSAEIRPIYRETYNLNRPEWRVLVTLAEVGPTTATAIGAHSWQHKTKVSRAVHALEVRRWLVREADPKDRRSEILALTEDGMRAYRKLTGPMREQEARLLGRLAADDRAALDQALKALEKALV